GYVPTYEDSLRIVCPAVFRPIYPNTANPETFQFGKEQIVVRIYNKTREIAQSGKGYWQHVWAVNPDYDPTQDVWRFELQLRRQALDELGCREPQEALASLDRLFAYGLEWANLRIPSGQSTDRWQEDPAWGELRAALFLGEPVARVKSVSYVGGTAK